jgi:glutamate synthase domain-containing protein 3
MMSGLVRVRGNAAQAAGATGRGGLLVIEGDAGARCGISMKGINIVVGGSIGHMSAFMAQAGTLVVCGDAGADLGDSIYEAKLFVAGDITSLGADCEEREMTPEDAALVEELLARTGLGAQASTFRYFGSARRLYNFSVDHAGSY